MTTTEVLSKHNATLSKHYVGAYKHYLITG